MMMIMSEMLITESSLESQASSQVLGAVAEFEKSVLVSKLTGGQGTDKAGAGEV